MSVTKSSAILVGSTAARMLLSLYTVKLTAITLGLAGTGIIGQFNNLLLIATMLAGGGIAAGIVKTAANQDRPLAEIHRELSSAHGYGLMFTAIVVVGILLGQKWLAPLLPLEHGIWLLIALAVSQYGLFQIAALAAILNSRNRQDLFAISSLAAGVVGALLITLGCIYFGLLGTLVGILVGALSQWFFLYTFARRYLPQLRSLGRPKLVRKDLRFWAHFSLLSLITVVGMPFAFVGVRNALAATGGWEAVGVWQAMVRLSDAYMQFGLLFLSAFYFPRLSATSTMTAAKVLLLSHVRIVLPAMILLFSAIFILRFEIVLVLFSDRFIGVTELFVPQLIGDAFKITSYLMTYAFLATGYYKLSMAAELAQAALFWLTATQFGLSHGSSGVAWSYAATYIIYFLMIMATFAMLVRADKDGFARLATLSPTTPAKSANQVGD